MRESQQNALLRALLKVPKDDWRKVPGFDRESPEVKALLLSGLVSARGMGEELHLRRREHAEEAIQRYLLERSVKALLAHDGCLDFRKTNPYLLDGLE